MRAVDRLLSDTPDTPRADARRNLERLIAAARTALADTGVTVTAGEIARRAGVGKGTFYRRVPSLDTLLHAVLHEILTEITTAAERADTDPDPWRGFTEFATAYVGLRAESCGVNDILTTPAPDLDATVADIRDALHRLVARAQHAGVLRADLTWHDIAFVLAAVPTPPSTLGLTAAPDQWTRTLRIVLDGLRPAPDPAQ
ncbi:TetR/AcrR family transcriptional regulator [Nocardia panacis]|nr:TetR/AcrR family transcriptional regulator [Nocardia panacis]